MLIKEAGLLGFMNEHCPIPFEFAEHPSEPSLRRITAKVLFQLWRKSKEEGLRDWQLASDEVRGNGDSRLILRQPKATTAHKQFQANTLNLYTSPSDHIYFDFATPAHASFGVYIQPCSQQQCCSKDSCPAGSVPEASCSNSYCGISDPTTTNCDTNEVITVNVLLGLEFACCWDNGSLTSQCGNTGGKVGGFITDALGKQTFTLPLKQCYDYPTDNAADPQAWQWLGTDDLNALIQPLCEPGTKGWTLALTTSYARAVASAAIADITWSGNNAVDALYFYGHFAVVTGTQAIPSPTPSPTQWDGPTTGITSGILCDQGSTNNVPPPTVASGAGVCTSQCGCYFMNLLSTNKSAGSVDQPATLYTFQVCVLCQYGFSYLTVCTGGLPMTGVQGTECQYTIGTKDVNGCTVIKWANPSCPFQFLNGACDIISILVYGATDGYVFQFGGHAGQGTSVVPITIDTSACTCGSLCMPTTPPATTTSVSTTTPAASTTTAQPTTTYAGETFPSTTPGASTTPSVTSPSSPAATTPTPCPDKFSVGSDCHCIYSGSGMLQAWCVPDGTGNYVWKLLNSSDLPTSPSADGWYRPGTTDGQGYKLSCSCAKQLVQCKTACTGGTCICNTADGSCIASSVCNIPTGTPIPGQVCAPSCPVGLDSAQCSNRGVCGCDGNCICGSVGGVNYTGAACEEVVGCGQFNDCTTCRTEGLQYNCAWCNYGAGAKCLSQGDCSAVGSSVDCSGTIVFIQSPCPDNCSNHGVCSNSSNITQCVCKGGYHGTNCAATGGLSTAAKAAAISGGVIAAIVIAGVIGLAIISFATKKAVDHVLLNEQASAKSHISPLYKETGGQGSSGIYQ